MLVKSIICDITAHALRLHASVYANLIRFALLFRLITSGSVVMLQHLLNREPITKFHAGKQPENLCYVIHITYEAEA